MWTTSLLFAQETTGKYTVQYHSGLNEPWILGLFCLGAVVILGLVFLIHFAIRSVKAASQVDYPSVYYPGSSVVTERPATMIRYPCPRCNTFLESAEQFAGSKVACPTCQGLLVVPHRSIDPTPLGPAAHQSEPSGRSVIRLVCPRCKSMLKVPVHRAGKKGRCPTCRQRLQVPLPSPSKTILGEAAHQDTTTLAASFAGSAANDLGLHPINVPDDRTPSRVGGLTPPTYQLEPHRGVMILVLGILSFFTAPIILGPIAWIMGNTDMQKIRAGVMDREGQGMTEAGRVCGMIATLLSLAAIAFVVLYFFCLCGVLVPAPYLAR